MSNRSSWRRTVLPLDPLSTTFVFISSVERGRKLARASRYVIIHNRHHHRGGMKNFNIVIVVDVVVVSPAAAATVWEKGR